MSYTAVELECDADGSQCTLSGCQAITVPMLPAWHRPSPHSDTMNSRSNEQLLHRTLRRSLLQFDKSTGKITTGRRYFRAHLNNDLERIHCHLRHCCNMSNNKVIVASSAYTLLHEKLSSILMVCPADDHCCCKVSREEVPYGDSFSIHLIVPHSYILIPTTFFADSEILLVMPDVISEPSGWYPAATGTLQSSTTETRRDMLPDGSVVGISLVCASAVCAQTPPQTALALTMHLDT